MRPWGDRAVAAAVLLAGIALVYVLGQVAPDARGHGTHEQLGMQPCSWPEQMQAPCPTCGVTTAATHLVHLSPVRAVGTQPFGAALAAAGIALAAWAAFCLLAQRSFMALLVRLPYGTIALGSLALLLAAWGYKYLTFVP
jgi:hypothetical protein